MSKKMKYLFSKSDCFKYSLYLCRKYHSRISIMATVNKAILLGYVGKDPEVRYVDQGVCVAQVRLATTERGYTLQNGTQVPDRTEWHNVVFYRGLAKLVEHYVHKGDKLYVEGRLRYRAYDDQRGQRRYVTEIVVDNMELLTAKPAATTAETQPVQPTADQGQNQGGDLPF